GAAASAGHSMVARPPSSRSRGSLDKSPRALLHVLELHWSFIGTPEMARPYPRLRKHPDAGPMGGPQGFHRVRPEADRNQKGELTNETGTRERSRARAMPAISPRGATASSGESPHNPRTCFGDPDRNRIVSAEEIVGAV